MFLVTTAEQKFWQPEEPTLFLGEWCKVYSQKHVWSKLNYEVLPYHGTNHSKLYQDYCYSQVLYEKTLIILSQKLNEVHNIQHPVRYWRIVLGFWLSGFIQVCLDRYRSISQAIESGKVKNTYVGKYGPDEFIPNDSNEFCEFFCEDPYNQFLYDYFIQALNGFHWESIECEHFEASSDKQKKIHKLDFKGSLIKIIRYWSKLIPDITQSVVFFNSYIPFADLIRLQLRLGQIPCPFWLSDEKYSTATRNIPINFAMRDRLRLPKSDDLFENLVNKLIHVQIPKVFVEEYWQTHHSAMKAFPKKPKVIITATHNSNELFKFWAGHQVDRGIELILTQHGGNVGDGLWSSNDDHELAISDRYFAWGWSRKNNDKVTDVPSPMINRNKKKIRPDPNGNILCITASFPRYPYVMLSAPMGPLVLETLNEQNKFFNSISREVFKLIVLRLFPLNRGWEEELRWPKMQPSLKTYRGPKSMYAHLNQSRLCVCFYNGTPMLEAFVSNFPTIVFFNPDHCELNRSAQPYFDELKEAGILFDDPKSAATKINKIYENPISWWKAKKVQKAKDRFCDQYAKCESNWIAQWNKEILN